MDSRADGEKTQMNLIKGAWDIHVHADPSIFPRKGTAKELVDECQKSGMSGIVLKAHHGSTVEIASVLNKSYPKISVYGGIVLNWFVGGLNPLAVDACINLGGKIVWLPTIHAEQHEKVTGKLGAQTFMKPKTTLVPGKGISILDLNKKVGKSMDEILQLLHKKEVVLATGHISKEEIFKLHDYIKEKDYKINLLITHVLFKTPKLSVEELGRLMDKRTWFELCWLSQSDKIKDTSIQTMADYIKKLPDANWVLASDTGQKHNPVSPVALEEFSNGLITNSVLKKKVEDMLITNPKKLLNL